MRKCIWLCLGLILILGFASCGDSGSSQLISKIAYIHEGATANSIVVMNTDGTGQDTVTSGGYYQGVDLSRDGKTIVTIGDDYQLYTINVASGQTTQITTDLYDAYDAMFTPDGTKIIFRSYTGDSGAQLYSINVNGTGLTQITTDPNICLHEPHISLDGSKIVFDFHDSTHSDVLAHVNIDGTGFTVVNSVDGIYTPAFSSDMKKVYFSRYNSTSKISNLFVVNVDGSGESTLLATGNSIDPIPVGSKIIFASEQTTPATGATDIYSINADGTGLKRLTTDGHNWLNYW